MVATAADLESHYTTRPGDSYWANPLIVGMNVDSILNDLGMVMACGMPCFVGVTAVSNRRRMGSRRSVRVAAVPSSNDKSDSSKEPKVVSALKAIASRAQERITPSQDTSVRWGPHSIYFSLLFAMATTTSPRKCFWSPHLVILCSLNKRRTVRGTAKKISWAPSLSDYKPLTLENKKCNKRPFSYSGRMLAGFR